jgi:hypothetical protein
MSGPQTIGRRRRYGRVPSSGRRSSRAAPAPRGPPPPPPAGPGPPPRPAPGGRGPRNRTHVLALALPLRSDMHVPVLMDFVTRIAEVARRHDHDLLLLTKDEGPAGVGPGGGGRPGGTRGGGGGAGAGGGGGC